MTNFYPIILAGCTAIGKSKLAVELAASVPSVIINADAIQIYGCWQVLSARPTKDDMKIHKHALFGHVPHFLPYSVGKWLKAVEIELKKAVEENLRPIIVGGTGLYFSLLFEGIADIPEISEYTRRKAQSLLHENFDKMLLDLQLNDPKILDNLDPFNTVRVQRAWEVLEQTGSGIRYWQKKKAHPLLNMGQVQPIVLSANTNLINKNINHRFKIMLSRGVIDEVQSVLKEIGNSDIDMRVGAFKAIGFKEIKCFIENKITMEALETIITQKTRQYAKRQRTWYRNKFQLWKEIVIDDNTDFKILRDHIDKKH